MKLINEHEVGLLVTASEDGIVRVWSGFDDPTEYYVGGGLRLVSAWRALTGLIPGNRGAGMILNWQQENGILVNNNNNNNNRN